MVFVHAAQAVGGSMAAAAVAAGMLLAPAPASAKLTFGRAADVAEQQVSCGSKGFGEVPARRAGSGA